MKMSDWISGKSSLLPSRVLTREEALYRMQPANLTLIQTFVSDHLKT
jgi:hypothetical protein